MSSPFDGSASSSTSPRLLIKEEAKESLEEIKSQLTPPEDRKLISTPELLTKPSTPKPLAQPTSFSEWQLLAVLQRANLIQYYDTFIAQGGDDINQIMQCDEQEFLEIMSLVGMLSKPLHVRRLQRALTEFSKDSASFNLAAIQHIGPPPPTPQFPLASHDAISYLMPAVELPCSSGHFVQSSLAASSSKFGGTANVCAGQQLLVDVGTTSETEARSTSPLLEDPTLTEEQCSLIATAARQVFALVPSLIQPKLVQNKKRVSSHVLDLMAMPVEHPNRLEEYRKYSAIYGRFDAKRRHDKGLSVHEVMVNEAAAQLCILMPALLTRRDDLFSLSRKVVSEAGLTTRKRRLTSSSPAPSPKGEQTEPSPGEDKKKKIVFNGLDSWAASRLRLPSPSNPAPP